MSRVVLDLEALRDNLATVAELLEGYGARWSVVTKALSGHADCLRALFRMGVRSVTDTRLDNLRAIRDLEPAVERWYLRPPHPSAAGEVVELAEVSLNTELSTVEALGRAAAARGLVHRIVPMVELGDLREGVPLGELVGFVERALGVPGIEVVGIGGQVGCLSGLAPSPEQVVELTLLRELLELKLGCELPVLSAGSTIHLPMLMDGTLPPGISHFRIGEALFLGTNLVTGGQLAGLRDDVIRLEAEVVELKEKSLLPLGETVETTPFEPVGEEAEAREASTGQRGFRALLAVGQLDTEVSGLTPVDPRHRIAGASSDIMAVNLGVETCGLEVGDHVTFATDYSAFVRLMSARYLPRAVRPAPEELEARPETAVPPVLTGPPAA